MNECVEAVVNWEGFLGGALMGAIVAAAWVSKKLKDKYTKVYTITEQKPDPTKQNSR